jgi:glutamine synthetase adenylyltransferase
MRAEAGTGEATPKHQPGGLVDTEFVAQLGVLTSALLFPRVLRVTGTLPQINELASIGWLSDKEAETLRDAFRRLTWYRMMLSLVPGESTGPEDTTAAAAVFQRKMRESS